MNERLKELAEQATRKYDRLGDEIPFAQPDLEIFAELIVRRAADMFAVEYGSSEGLSGNRVAVVLKQYFGVEE